jgi:apolipoprotein D and lipocalin family protein
MSSVPSTIVPPPLEPALSLDERIRRAELRLIAREDNLKRRIDSLGRRLHEVAQLRRYVVPAVGGALGLLALWLLLRGRLRPLAARAATAAASRAPGGHARGASGELPWASLLGLAWPLLPAAWRSRVNPTTAATVLGVGLPLIQRVLAGAPHRPLATAAQIDLARYAGTWHEIARMPAPFEATCAGQPSAHYTLHADGVEVLNRCLDRHGRERESRGVARVVPGSGNAKLKVTFAPRWLHGLPLVWADYWVLHVDESYQIALVGQPSRRHLWVLSRHERIPREQLAALMQYAAELDFPVERLQIVQPDG